MKQVHFLFILFLFSLSVFSQTDSTKISFVAYWSIGDSYDFKVSKVNREWRNEILTKSDSSQYIANFKILDSTETSYKIQWTYKNDLVSTFQEKIHEIFENKQVVNEILQKNDLSKIIYETNELGEFIQILNWKELSESTRLLLEEMVRSFEIKEPEKIELFKKVMKPIIEIYSSKIGIEQILAQELQFFHYPFGLEYDITEPIKYENEIPNMAGGKPIGAESTLTFEEVDFENYYCVIKEETILNSDDAKGAIQEIINKMEVNNANTKGEIENALLDIRDLNYYQYFYYPGVPNYIYGSRKTIIKIDKINIEKINELFIELFFEE